MELSIAQPYEYIGVLLVCSLVVYRLGKLLTSDKIFEDVRNSLIVKIGQDKNGGWHSGIRDKIVYLIGCEICAGSWISIIVGLIIYDQIGFDSLISFIFFIVATSGLQIILSKLSHE